MSERYDLSSKQQEKQNYENTLSELLREFSKIKPENDLKLIELINTIRNKIFLIILFIVLLFDF